MSSVLLVQEGFNGAIEVRAHRVRLRDRVVVHLQALPLDRVLADGASPEASVQLALRARLLARPRERRGYALRLLRIVEEGDRSDPGFSARIPICRPKVRRARRELMALSAVLMGNAPLPVSAIARVRVLLTDGGGPLYCRPGTDDLRPLLRGVLRSAVEPADEGWDRDGAPGWAQARHGIEPKEPAGSW